MHTKATEIKTKPSIKVSLIDGTIILEPPMYAVLIHNNYFTPFEFVIAILCDFFGKSAAEADKIAQLAHHNGMAVVEITTKDIAETKVARVQWVVAQNGFPLKFNIEMDS